MNILTDYRKIWNEEKDSYEEFGHQVKVEVLKILKENGISAKVTYRIKETDSLIKKIARKNSNYDSIHDKVGVRVVAYFQDQMYLIDNLIKEGFKFCTEKRQDMGEKLGENVFGYQSIHYDICRLINGKQQFCELQLRTICQDNWSELSHALAYKTEINLPLKIKRELNALSAVFELADNQFQLIQSLISELPDTNPIRILNHIEKYYYSNIGNAYDKELSSYFMKGIEDLYENESPTSVLDEFLSKNGEQIIKAVEENNENFFFSQPEILIILERLENRKYDLINYWNTLYPLSELEDIANIWGTSIE